MHLIGKSLVMRNRAGTETVLQSIQGQGQFHVLPYACRGTVHRQGGCTGNSN